MPVVVFFVCPVSVYSWPSIGQFVSWFQYSEDNVSSTSLWDAYFLVENFFSPVSSSGIFCIRIGNEAENLL